MTERVCLGSGQRPATYRRSDTGKVACPHCGRMVYVTMRDGRLYKHKEPRGMRGGSNRASHQRGGAKTGAR